MSENALLDSLNEVYIKGQANTAKRIREATEEDTEDIVFDGWSETIKEFLKTDLGINFSHNQALLEKWKTGTREQKIRSAKDKEWEYKRFREAVIKMARATEISLE